MLTEVCVFFLFNKAVDIFFMKTHTKKNQTWLTLKPYLCARRPYVWWRRWRWDKKRAAGPSTRGPQPSARTCTLKRQTRVRKSLSSTHGILNFLSQCCREFPPSACLSTQTRTHQNRLECVTCVLCRRAWYNNTTNKKCLEWNET